MSELDVRRRELLAELLRSGGQAVVTATEPGHVPGADEQGVQLLEALDGTVRPIGEPAERMA
jgi:recombinational DNA repair ATPase RecF